MSDVGHLGDMVVTYSADLSGLETGSAQAKAAIGSVADGADQASRGFLGHISDMGSGMLHFAGTVGGAIMGFENFYASAQMLVYQFQALFSAVEEHQDIMAQTAQALKSTKDASGETASSIDDLATSLSEQTRFSADSIQQAENLELTFTNIGQSVFPQTTQAILDVSQAMHQDLRSSAIEVGKALNDPATGMTELRRIGVSFTATEQEEIKTMMAHNDVIGAQKIILHELATEFGGSAQAASKTFAGQLDVLNNRFEDLKIKIGSALIPVLNSLLDVVSPLLDDVLNLQINTGLLSNAFTTIGAWVDNITTPAFNALRAMIDLMSPVFSALGTVVSTEATPAFQTVSNVASVVSHGFTDLSGVVKGSTDQAFDILSTDLKESVVPHLEQLSTTVSGDVNSSMTAIQPVIYSIADALGQSLTNAANVAQSALQSSSTWMNGVGSSAYNTFTGVVGTVADAYQRANDKVVAFAESLHIPLAYQPPFLIFAGIISDVLGDSWLKARDDALAYADAVKAALPSVPSNIGKPNIPDIGAPKITVQVPQLDSIIGPFQKVLDWIQSDFVPGFQGAIHTAENIWQGAMGVFEAVAQPWINTFNMVKDDLMPAFEQFGQWWQTTMDPLFGKSGISIGNVGQGLYNLYANAVKGFGYIVEWIVKAGLALTETFGPALTVVGGVIGTAFGWLVNTAIPTINSFFQWFNTNVGPGISAAFSWWVDTAIPAIDSWWQKQPALIEAMLKPIDDVINGIQNIGNWIGNIGNLIGKWSNWISNLFGGGGQNNTPTPIDTSQPGAGGVGNLSSNPISGLLAHASGGIIPPGHYGIVDEQGQELMYGGTSGISVLPAPQTASLFASASSPALYAGGGKGVSYGDIHIYLGEREIGRAMASDSGFIDAVGTGAVKRIRQLGHLKR